jgi:ketopantoate reductase
MRIAIFGTGGAGGYFGAQLARVGEDVIFIARGEHLQAIHTQGLRVETSKGEIVIQPAQAAGDPAQVGVGQIWGHPLKGTCQEKKHPVSKRNHWVKASF